MTCGLGAEIAVVIFLAAVFVFGIDRLIEWFHRFMAFLILGVGHWIILAMHIVCLPLYLALGIANLLLFGSWRGLKKESDDGHRDLGASDAL